MSEENVELAQRASEALRRRDLTAWLAIHDGPVDEAEIVDAGADKVLIHQQYDVRGSTSGADVDFDYWLVATFRQGKILRVQSFAERAEALEAARLSE